MNIWRLRNKNVWVQNVLEDVVPIMIGIAVLITSTVHLAKNTAEKQTSLKNWLVKQDCEGTQCPGGCCPQANYFCCPDDTFCAPSADFCPWKKLFKNIWAITYNKILYEIEINFNLTG